MIEFTQPGQQPYRIYISGDTLAVNALRDVTRRFDAIDLGLFHLGGTRIFGVLLTMDGEQGARAIEMIQPRTAVPIHYDDYDVFKSPLSEFQAAITKASPISSVVVLERGDSLQLTPPAGRT
jgi:L-ascorbate metabolism protein UlaG (beta-lactamase superfamily)